jgi:hypothetical protein
MPERIRVGQLRWPVRLVQRVQAAQASPETGIIETPADPVMMHADIQPLGAMTFYGAIAADPDKPVTHRIIMRWTDYVDYTHAIERITNRPDGSQRVETFRVRRMYEIEGRKRFVCMESQLESVPQIVASPTPSIAPPFVPIFVPSVPLAPSQPVISGVSILPVPIDARFVPQIYNLPNIADITERIVIVFDQFKAAASNNITISGSSVGAVLINQNGGSVPFFWSGSAWVPF